MHDQDAFEVRDFTPDLSRQNILDINHDIRGPMQYSGPQRTSTTALPLPVPPNNPYTGMYIDNPYAPPVPSQTGARPSNFPLLASPDAAANHWQPPYPPHTAIPPTPPATHDHAYSVQKNHMVHYQLDPILSTDNVPGNSTYYEGYLSPLDFPLNEHGLPALIGEESRQPSSCGTDVGPMSRASSMDSAGSMDHMQHMNFPPTPHHLQYGDGVESMQHPSARFIHSARKVRPGDRSMASTEPPYAPDGGESRHPISFHSGEYPPIAPPDDVQRALHMLSSYTQPDGAGKQASYASPMALYGQYDPQMVVNEGRPMSMLHHVAHPPSTLPAGSDNYLQNATAQQPGHQVPGSGYNSYEPSATLQRSTQRGPAIRKPGNAGTDHRYAPYPGAAQRVLPPIPNTQFGSVGQHVQPNNTLKPRPQPQHVVIRTRPFSGNTVPAVPVASQDVIYGPTPTSGPSAGTAYGNKRGAAATTARGGETKAPSTRPPNDGQLRATSTIGGGTQYQWIGGPGSRQREWQSGTRHIANVSAPTQTAAGLATRGLAMPFAHLPRLEPSASLLSANHAAAASSSSSSSHVPSALADGVAGVPPAALVHSFQVVPAPSAPERLIGVQPDPKHPEHADPQRPWLFGDDGSKADRIKKFIADEAERTGHDSWPRMCPHSDCKKFLQWLDGKRAQQPTYKDEDALLRHIERCGDEVCEFCFVEGAFFGRPALAHIHRAGHGRKGCPTMAKCGGVRNIVGVYAWLEKHCTRERIEQVVASYQLGEKVRNGKPFGKYMKILHADVLGGDVTARALVDTARMALDAGGIPAFAVQYSMPA